MRQLARRVPDRGSYRVYLVGGGTAVLSGWRESTIDVDLYADEDVVFANIQSIKEDLQVNVELVRPEHFVPQLEGTERRHVFIESHGNVSYYHYDPYAQLLSKVVRGFRRDLQDAESLVRSGMVQVVLLRDLVVGIPEAAFDRYPALSKEAVDAAVETFLRDREEH